MPAPPENIICITGTDTGVGKTLLTASLLHHLRHRGLDALAIKPFCTGPRTDVALLQALQKEAHLPLETVNPSYFPEPLAPLIAARKHRRLIPLAEVIDAIRRVAQTCSCLLVEGIGGLMVPLGPGYTFLDLLTHLRPGVILVSRNRLGTINHTLLTAYALEARGLRPSSVVLMNRSPLDPSTSTNCPVLRKLLAPTPVLPFPDLGPRATHPRAILRHQKKIHKLLARIIH